MHYRSMASTPLIYNFELYRFKVGAFILRHSAFGKDINN